jgi:dipeptidyl aminopeptidase/acylaminoacyl peptidase
MQITDVPHYRPIVGSAISNDGRWVAVVSPQFIEATGDRLSHMTLCDLSHGGRSTQIELPEGVEGYSPCFSPDSRQLAFFRRGPDDEAIALITLDDDLSNIRLLPQTPPVPSALKWDGDRLACLGNDPEGWRRVWRFDNLNAAPTSLTPDQCHAGDFAFQPHGSTLVWLRIPTLDETLSGDVHLETLDETSGKTGVLDVPGAPVGYLAFSPDGDHLAFQSRPRDKLLHHAQLWIFTMSEGIHSRSVTQHCAGWITGFDWNETGTGLFVGFVQGTKGTIRELSLEGQELSSVAQADRYFSGPHCDRNTGRLIHLEQSTDTPQRVCIRESREHDSQVLFDFNTHLRGETFASATTETWETEVGVQVEGIFYNANHGDTVAPMIVWLHGGPAEQISHTFSPYFQVFARAGFSVFCPNYRGSSGRDDDYLRANVGRLGQVDVVDVIAGVQHLVNQGLATPEAIHAVGWSYGGSLALLTAMTSELFGTLVVGAPVVDWVSFFGSRRLPSLYRDYFPSPLWEDRTLYDAASPLTHIARLEAKTLVLHGAMDPVVDVSQSRLLYRVLKARGVQTDLMVYPNEGHVPKATNAVADMLQRILSWLEEPSVSSA